MPSPTSSVNDRLPSGSWGRTWLLVFSLLLLVVGGWEGWWRLHGWNGMVNADAEDWVLARLRVAPGSTVLIGTSRAGAALDPLVWAAAAHSDPPVMLAVEGSSPLPVLSDLAGDTTFHGVVVAEMMPMVTFAYGTPQVAYLPLAREAVISPAKRWEAWLRVHVGGHLVFRRGDLEPVRLIKGEYAHPLRPAHWVLRDDQYRPMDFALAGRKANLPEVLDTSAFVSMRRWIRPADSVEVDRRMTRIASDVARIQQRGGQVVFVNLQACGGRRAIEQHDYPRARYWDRLRAVPGVFSFDSDDYPEILALPCYDGSHVDMHDAPIVTRRIAESVTAALAAAPSRPVPH